MAVLSSVRGLSQTVVPLYKDSIPNSIASPDEERSEINKDSVLIISKVSRPTLTVYLPPKEKATGAAVIICPGGGFHALSINGEGYDVANWLTKKGITCFVLKYRLAHTISNDPVQEWVAGLGTKEGRANDSAAILLAIASRNCTFFRLY